eukprot:CAMPEP_0167752156 /NCGR_PEP_ID=MMETSP0110_2-20121227/6975_1 /TAXON_ID=629695 /ORGANISM="Gymnochlora sp., Strain CCMP2014" /LENGTH=763 /DNA_ID=CAMNT_0007637727 /DNA_START=27 /DNA_END=2318 /DNA_ORIENTATION=-
MNGLSSNADASRCVKRLKISKDVYEKTSLSNPSEECTFLGKTMNGLSSNADASRCVKRLKISKDVYEKTSLSNPSEECTFLGKTMNALILVGSVSELKIEGEELKMEVDYLFNNFHGTVYRDVKSLPTMVDKTVYMCGNVKKAANLALGKAKRVFIIKDISFNYEGSAWSAVNLGRVPVTVHNVGVFYRQFFKSEHDLYNRVRAEHGFQALTESTKPGKALRTGIYLTSVEKKCDDLHFNLLRCSSNLSGPTSNFGANDRRIIKSLNDEAATLFNNPAQLNHVLAQIYHNAPAIGKLKQTKAKISTHADKTKDMPLNSLMAFCTFYNHLNRLIRVGMFDYAYCKKNSNAKRMWKNKKYQTGLTKLVFRLKSGMKEKYPNLTPSFNVLLYPNSVFFMPISTNRVYTHEIRPSNLPAQHLPTRLGYVVRCSCTRAVHRKGKTFVVGKDEKLIPLEKPSDDGMKAVKELYRIENFTDAIVDYKHPVLFSMNRGDYIRPEYELPDEFRWFALEDSKEGKNIFQDLLKSVTWEQLGKGRQGTVLVKPEKRGVPIVRTTAKFAAPAHKFQPVHEHLARQIKAEGRLIVEFNNALFETYTNAYRKMGFHSDMALDLEEGTSIALYSCYKYPERGPPRSLVIQSKEPGGGEREIPLVHNSVVTFTVDTNRRFRHKIVLPEGNHDENQWIGVTFRTSKTYVRENRDGKPIFEDGTPLRLLETKERSQFFQMRGRENKETEFSYPKIRYTFSPSDLMPPTTMKTGTDSTDSSR